MHKSQLAGFIIDCKTEDLDAAADFWSAALGMPRTAADTPAKTSYVHLQKKDPNGLDIEVQKVGHESRVHLDIESDDVEATRHLGRRLGDSGRRERRSQRQHLACEDGRSERRRRHSLVERDRIVADQGTAEPKARSQLLLEERPVAGTRYEQIELPGMDRHATKDLI